MMWNESIVAVAVCEICFLYLCANQKNGWSASVRKNYKSMVCTCILGITEMTLGKCAHVVHMLTST